MDDITLNSSSLVCRGLPQFNISDFIPTVNLSKFLSKLIKLKMPSLPSLPSLLPPMPKINLPAITIPNLNLHMPTLPNIKCPAKPDKACAQDVKGASYSTPVNTGNLSMPSMTMPVIQSPTFKTGL